MDERRNSLNAARNKADPVTPAAFVEALRRLEGQETVDVPKERNDDILTMCRDELRTRLTGANPESAPSFDHQVAGNDDVKVTCAKILSIPFCRLRWAAAAAIVVLAFGTAYWARRPSPKLAVNVDQPTILDAFALARRIESKRPTATRFDVNKDGKIDRTDVELLAQKAVALPEGGAL